MKRRTFTALLLALALAVVASPAKAATSVSPALPAQSCTYELNGSTFTNGTVSQLTILPGTPSSGAAQTIVELQGVCTAPGGQTGPFTVTYVQSSLTYALVSPCTGVPSARGLNLTNVNLPQSLAVTNFQFGDILVTHLTFASDPGPSTIQLRADTTAEANSVCSYNTNINKAKTQAAKNKLVGELAVVLRDPSLF